MWFLGAGAPRSARLPTAQDIIWDLKRQCYCLQENQDIQTHDVRNSAIRARIQDYVDGKGFPAAWDPDEYSFYFKLVFGDDHGAQQDYLQRQLSTDKVALTIGQRAFAALLAMGRTRIAFTTNFDEVAETAYAFVTGRTLAAFHIEGSYAALDALNAERFPLYAKVHGDFRYRSIKNLSDDLRANDAELQKCFIAAAGRYGLVVSGYSGRDANVMAMFRAALEQPNPFPHGIWWTTPRLSDMAPTVSEFLDQAQRMGVRACAVEAGPFDSMLSKIWRQLPDKPEDLDRKVRSARAQVVSIALPHPGRAYPILRTNALPVTACPPRCGALHYKGSKSVGEIFASIREHEPEAIVSFDKDIVFWGDGDQVSRIFGNDVLPADPREFADPASAVRESTYIKSFMERCLAESLCRDKPVLLRKRRRTYYAVVDYQHQDEAVFQPLKNTVGEQGRPGAICGTRSQQDGVYWAEAVSLKLEERGGSLRLLLEPDIWIKPLAERENEQDFLRQRRLFRRNRQAYDLLNAWIEILLGTVGAPRDVSVACFPESSYPARFDISTRTAYSRRGS
jgi:hypothetical protein